MAEPTPLEKVAAVCKELEAAGYEFLFWSGKKSGDWVETSTKSCLRGDADPRVRKLAADLEALHDGPARPDFEPGDLN